MYCRFCGKQIPDDAKFCSYCGKKLEYDPDGVVKAAKEKNQEDENYKVFKKSYSKGALPALIWFGALNVIGSIFLAFGLLIASLIFLSNGGELDFTFISIYYIIYQIMDEAYYVIVPIMYTIGYLIASIFAIILGRRIAYGKKDNFEAAPKNINKLRPKEFILILFTAFFFWGFGIAIGNLPAFFYESGISEVELIFGNYIYLYLFQAMFCAPIIEEYFFRKLLIDKIAPQGEALAILASGLLFGLMHGNLGQFFFAFALGCLFALVYIKTRNIKYTMLLHFIINTIASIPEIFMMFNINIEIAWYIVIGSLALIGLIIFIIFRKQEIFKINKECSYDGYLIHRSVIFEIFFILTLVILSVTTAYNLFYQLLFDLDPYILLELVPISGFIVFIILYNRQVHKVLKGRPKEEIEENIDIDEIEDENIEELSDLEKIDE